MLKVNYRFLLVSLAIIVGNFVKANDNATIDKYMPLYEALNRIEQLKKDTKFEEEKRDLYVKNLNNAVSCEQAKREILVNTLQCCAATFEFKNATEEERNVFYKRSLAAYLSFKGFLLLKNGIKFFKLKNKENDNDVVIQNYLSTMHAKNVFYNLAKVKPALNSISLNGIITVDWDDFNGFVPNDQRFSILKGEDLINICNQNISMINDVVSFVKFFTSSKGKIFFHDKYLLNPLSDFLLLLSKEFGVVKNISLKEKLISQDLSILCPLKNLEPSNTSFVLGLLGSLNVLLKLQENNRADPRIVKIGAEALLPLIVKIIVPLVIKP